MANPPPALEGAASLRALARIRNKAERRTCPAFVDGWGASVSSGHVGAGEDVSAVAGFWRRP